MENQLGCERESNNKECMKITSLAIRSNGPLNIRSNKFDWEKVGFSWSLGKLRLMFSID